MVKVTHIQKSFGSLKIFTDLTLEFPPGKITVVLGPSGCGKTTLLNILAGLREVEQGALETENASYLFQEPRLLPWLTVYQNIALVLADKLTQKTMAERVDQLITAVGLQEFSAYLPNQLSGGMKQRVALARAFAYEAPLLLMDEPFKSLDLKARYRLMQDFLVLWQQQRRTVVMVTHDVREAVWLGERIILLSDKPTRVLEEIMVPFSLEDRFSNKSLLELEQTLIEKLVAPDVVGGDCFSFGSD